jgi:hypothetical protein
MNKLFMDSPIRVLAVLAVMVVVFVFTAQASNQGDVSLNVDVLESAGNQVDSNGNYIIYAPAKYKVVRAAYGDNCYYNLTGGQVYGQSEDVISINVARKSTYTISCQSFFGGEINSKSVTVTVVNLAEANSLPQTVLSAAK